MDTRKFLIIAGAALGIFIILVLILVFVAKPKTPKESTLTIWNLDDDKTAFSRLITDFQNSHPQVKVEYIQKDPQDYFNNVLTEIAKGSGPDVLAIPNDWLPKYHDLFSPLPQNKIQNAKQKKSDLDVYQETFPQVATDDNIINQKIYGMPLSIDTLGLYYNPELLSQAFEDYRKTQTEISAPTRQIFNAGPKNWDEFRQAVQIITQKSGKNIILSGAALGINENVKDSPDILTALMLQFGAKMTTDDFSAALFHTAQNQFEGRDFPGTAALDFYTGFANPEDENYTWNTSFPEAVEAFAEEKTAMLIAYDSAKKDLKRLNPSLNFALIDLPQVKATAHPLNFASYNTFAVNKTSANTDLAWDFIVLMTSRDYARDYQTETGKPPALLQQIDKEKPAFTARSWFKPDPQKADEIFRQMISGVNSGQTAQTAIEAAASQITNLLGEIKK